MGNPRLEFEGHLAGLTSSLPHDFEDNAHQTAVEGKDNRMRLVKSCGLAFVPCATSETTLKQGQRTPITKVISRAFASLGLQDRTFDPALNWMQASFMYQVDGTYTGHICTC